jgi:isocitrate dehydrogenase (NAD+)
MNAVANRFHRKVRTKDMGGNSSTHDFTNAVLAQMEKL